MLKEPPAGISRLRIGVCKGSFLEERSGDGALAHPARSHNTKAVSRFACHRTPHLRTTNAPVAVSRCTPTHAIAVYGLDF